MSDLVWPGRLRLASDTQVPASWSSMPGQLPEGTILIVGAPDSGKTTLARCLFRRLATEQGRVAFLDCDVGQSTLGLPATQNLAIEPGRSHGWQTLTFFVGAVSPRGHMLPFVTGAHRLQVQARKLGARTIIVDSTGLVDAAAGGVALKHTLGELLRPCAVVGLTKSAELEPILGPWRHDRRLQVYELPVPPQASVRNSEARISYRHQSWRRYFAHPAYLRFSLPSNPCLAAYGLQWSRPGLLMAFRGARGFVLALGIIQSYDRGAQEFTVRTPLADMGPVHSVLIGDVRFHVGNDVREWSHG